MTSWYNRPVRLGSLSHAWGVSCLVTIAAGVVLVLAGQGEGVLLGMAGSAGILFAGERVRGG